MSNQPRTTPDDRDPTKTQTVENPGDPGMPTIAPAERDDPRKDPKLPPPGKAPKPAI